MGEHILKGILALSIVTAMSTVVSKADETRSDLPSLPKPPLDNNTCTRCSIWQGDNCFEYKPCVFCNETHECQEPLYCQANICTLDPFFGGGSRRDPLGRIIALSLLAIFLLGIFTLCIRICANTCGSNGRRCCVVQCAISVQCCCDWKVGRMRVVPPHGNSVGPSGTHHRRESLYPPPPPSYGEIYPEEQRSPQQQQQNERSNVDRTEERPAARSNNFLRWFRPLSPSQSETSYRHFNEHCTSHSETGNRRPRNRGWFRRATNAIIWAGYRQPEQRRQNHQQTYRPQETFVEMQVTSCPQNSTAAPPGVPWTTVESSALHQMPSREVFEQNEVENETIKSESIRNSARQSPFEPPDSISFNNDEEDFEDVVQNFDFSDDGIDTEDNLHSALHSLLDYQSADLQPEISRRENTSRLTNPDDTLGGPVQGDEVLDMDVVSWTSGRASSTLVTDLSLPQP